MALSLTGHFLRRVRKPPYPTTSSRDVSRTGTQTGTEEHEQEEKEAGSRGTSSGRMET